tara:strand:- start:48 stop:419 length:372 start_codon:yes stop_codon:yes gene_type:complete
MSIKLIAENGLPLKIIAEWTSDTYWNRRSNFNDELDEVKVEGWLIKINGKKYPRGNVDGEGYPDWTYRYTTYGNTMLGKWTAIDRALTSAKLKPAEPRDVIREVQMRLFTWAEKQTMREGFNA